MSMGVRLAAIVVLSVTLAPMARPSTVPISERLAVQPLERIERLTLAPVDIAAARAEDSDRRAAGEPDRFAMAEDVYLTPETHGTWEELPAAGLVLWRLRIVAPGCLSLNLGCERFFLPPGGRLVLHAADGRGPVREFTERDIRPHGQLWTPVVLGDELVMEMTLPLTARDDYALAVIHVGKGYRTFGEDLVAKSGTCNVDVVCPEGDPWRNEIASVARITISGSFICTAAMINNTAQDATPYLLTAAHCGINALSDASVVVYWNFESPVCGDQSGGSLEDTQSGSIFRANLSDTDFCLVELEELPDPLWGVAWAGWNRADAAPDSVTTIHHPSADEKSISFEYDATEITSREAYDSPGDGTHLRVVDWDLGTTEGGSSGAPLFDARHRIIGQLYGGYASCINNESDWYGRFYRSWEGGGTADNRLRDWLDPLGTAPLTVDTFAPGASGFWVAPSAGVSAQGDPGGPFAPETTEYTMENLGSDPLDYLVTVDQPWVNISGGSGTLAGNASTAVTIGFGPEAVALDPGFYNAVVSFANLTDGVGNTSRGVALQVGSIEVQYAWNMDTDPGWQREGEWEWGVPQGAGGANGNPDPAAGHTGTNVLGYNLAGDYAPFLEETSLTTGPLDCRNLLAVSLRFRRWLGVETAIYDHAYVRASTDNVNWTNVWANGGQVTDAAWELVEYDLSALADGTETLYLRWVMGTTDELLEFCGWNLDDIEILGLHDGTVGIEDPGDDGTPPPAAPTRLAVRSWPNPFNPQTTIAFDVPRPQHVSVAVHDARGRRVRVLYDGHAESGTERLVWDGTDERGGRLASGVYFVQVLGTYQRVTHKISLLK